MENTDQPYLFTEFQPALPAARTREIDSSSPRVLLHCALLAATAITTTLTGAAWEFQGLDDSVSGFLVSPVLAVLRETATGNFFPLTKGLLFTFTLLTILGAHELGHYFACRHYGIRATLPFFIPAPPMITLFGTFGAVIKIQEPIRSRRALFDIGIAGPLAGFAFAAPAAIIGLLFATPAPPSAVAAANSGGAQFHDPLLFVLISKVMGLPVWIEWNPIYWAAWATLLVTALNLFPVGQLDGGHVVYAVLGRRPHAWISRITTVACGGLAVYSIATHQPPVYLLWTVVLLFLMKVGHPPVVEDEPLGAVRVAIAVLAVLVFVLCFMRFPITSN